MLTKNNGINSFLEDGENDIVGYRFFCVTQCYVTHELFKVGNPYCDTIFVVHTNKIANFVGYREGDEKHCLSSSAKISDGRAIGVVVIEIIKMLFASLDFVTSDNL